MSNDDIGNPALAALMEARPGAPVDLLDTLAALAQRPAWHASAACRGRGTGTFFVERGESMESAQAVCAECPVVDPCRVAGEGEVGVWGGTTGLERRQQRAAA